MALNETEKTACRLLLNSIRTDYLGGKLTNNTMGLTARDLNVPQSKHKDTANFLRSLPPNDRIVTGTEATNHVLMYIVTGGQKKLVKLDITGHQIEVKNGTATDKTKNAGWASGAAPCSTSTNYVVMPPTCQTTCPRINPCRISRMNMIEKNVLQ